MIAGAALAAPATWWWTTTNQSWPLLSPFVDEYQSQTRPLQKYALKELAHFPWQASQIEFLELSESSDSWDRYTFAYKSGFSGHTISGLATLPKGLTRYSEPSVIIMARGYVPVESYFPGSGTKNAAAYYAERGFVTLAPDFLGYGSSDPEPENTWESRFLKPVHLVELIITAQQSGFPTSTKATADGDIPLLKATKLGLWGHSNGGQVVLTALEVLDQPLPSTLWAPVTAPFPYSVLFYGDELADEGKSQRAWLQIFEAEYDVFDFSLTQHLDLLAAGLPLQVHHGTLDEAAPIAWSTEFAAKLESENKLRQATQDTWDAMIATAATDTAAPTPVAPKTPLDFKLFTYPGADHNLQPGWQSVVQRDLQFFERWLE